MRLTGWSGLHLSFSFVDESLLFGDVQQMSGIVAHHVRILDTSMYSRVIVISDVHGCVDALDRLLDKLNVTADFDGSDLLIFVGDLVNKGPDGPGVVRRVQSLTGALSVRGNHEEKLNKDKEISDQDKFTEDELNYLKNLPLSISLVDRNLVIMHAGIKTGVEMEKQKKDDLLRMRTIDVRTGETSDEGEDEFHQPWARLYPGPQFVVFGHHAKLGLQREKFALGIDTGCVYGRELTAAVFPRGRSTSEYELVHVVGNSLSA